MNFWTADFTNYTAQLDNLTILASFLIPLLQTDMLELFLSYKMMPWSAGLFLFCLQDQPIFLWAL